MKTVPDDGRLCLMNMFFMPAVYGYKPPSRTQAISFLADSTVLLIVWWCESLRNPKAPWILRM